MDNVKEFLSRTLQATENISDSFVKFMEFYLVEINKLKYDSEPNYGVIHKKLEETLADLGHSKYTKDNFYIINPAAKLAVESKKSKVDKQESVLESKITDKAVAKKRLENGKALTPSRKRQPCVDDLLESDSNDSIKSSGKFLLFFNRYTVKYFISLFILESNSKKSRSKQPRISDEANDESQEVVKKSPLLKIKKKETINSKSNLVQSPARETPKRAATSRLKTSYAEICVSDTDSEIDYLPIKPGELATTTKKKSPKVGKSEKKLPTKVKSELIDNDKVY